MKKTLIFLFIVCSVIGLAQAPKLINYQGVARNAGGVAMANTSCTLTIDITSGTYVEKHFVTSNAVGIFTLHIGGGTPVSGSFASINWGGAANYINVTINTGSGPFPLGTQQLVSVPYALYAETSGSSSASSYVAGSGIAISSGSVISNTAPDQTVTLTPTGPITISGAYPSFTIGASSSTTTGFPPTFFINAPNTVTSNTLANSYTFGIVPPTASFSAGILTLNPGGDTTMIPMGGPWVKSGTDVYLNNISDNVGIGTTTPAAKLQVIGGASGNDVSIVDVTSPGDALQINKFTTAGRGEWINMGSATTGTALAITTLGSGPGIFVDANSSDNAIHARSTGSLATILGDNFTGNGSSVQGLKSGSTGNAGLFNITYASSNSDALVGSTVGGGAAVRAIAGPALSSSLALWADNGHIKSSASIPPVVSTVSVSGGGISAITFTCNQCTDVKGSMLAVITTSTMVNPGNNATIKVTFTKNYSIIPTVIITPTSDYGQLNYFVSAVTNNSFNLTIRNPTTLSLNTPSAMPVNFNYFVIE